MKLAIVSSYDQGFSALAELTMPNREAYARMHGFTCITKVQDAPGGRKPVWGKLLIALDVLQEYDFLWLMDADCIITNPTIKPTWLDIPADMIIGSDINGLNAGNVFVRRSAWSAGFLQHWWDAGDRFACWTAPEQSALAHLLYLEMKDKWAVLSQRVFNSYQYSHYDYGAYRAGEWQPGDFLLHLPGIANEKRINVFKELPEC